MHSGDDPGRSRRLSPIARECNNFLISLFSCSWNNVTLCNTFMMSEMNDDNYDSVQKGLNAKGLYIRCKTYKFGAKRRSRLMQPKSLFHLLMRRCNFMPPAKAVLRQRGKHLMIPTTKIATLQDFRDGTSHGQYQPVRGSAHITHVGLQPRHRCTRIPSYVFHHRHW